VRLIWFNLSLLAIGMLKVFLEKKFTFSEWLLYKLTNGIEVLF